LKSQSKRNYATREDWIKAALGALHKQGPKGLNIQALAGQLNISKTSFYWHFKNKAELLDKLIDLWLPSNRFNKPAKAGLFLLDFQFYE
jgi:AcrR family transcriptional regulator